MTGGRWSCSGCPGTANAPFPGRHGRLRAGLVVDHTLTSYESAAQEWHLDLAGRYSGSFGPLDVGLSVFDGTSREPTLSAGLYRSNDNGLR